MPLLIAGLVLFLGVHSLSIFAPGLRDTMVARLGLWPYKAVYGLVALAGLVLIVQGYGAARGTTPLLYDPPQWTAHITMALMLIAFPAFISTYLPGRISATLKHPTLVAVKAWALAHLLSAGSLAALALFGGFLAWAVLDRISMKRRAEREIPRAPASAVNDLIVVVAGLAVYFGFAFWAHPRWIGVPVMG